ncbi:MAG TPA: DoxX family protein, partial [Bacteroidia bacterium]|nr:DoxX family protein [Bacteroidia bacterium]
MKKTKIIYWSTTILFAAFMIFSAIPNIRVVDEAKQFLTHLGYPVYFIPFIGVAKLLGSIALLIPSFRYIKEWAYAGLFFNLIGAVYSNLVTDGFHPSMLVMLAVFAVAITSYIYNRRYYGG